ncbi:MAG: putative transport system, permease component [Cyanobacteria bacterium RYN_339]|nr:putative transport system, permease component [Cyanobacteria bacterium RYN_339]
MTQIFAIARNTFRETIRDRILNAIVVFAVVLIGASILLGQLSAGQDIKIIKDLGLASLGFFGVIIAIFVGTSLVHKELDKRTVFVVLTKPVHREVFLVGKLLGLLTTLTVLVLAMGAAYIALLALLKVPLTLGIFQAIGFSWLELLVLTTVTLVFSTFSTPVLCMLYAFALYFIGHNASTFYTLAKKAGMGLQQLLLALYYILPNLEIFDIKNKVVYNYVASAQEVTWAVVYAFGYSAFLFAVAALIFRRREF